MNNELTTRQFWLDYWESKDGLVFEVENNYPFIQLLARFIKQNNAKNMLEIGGFPGYYSVWAKRHLGLNTTLLDFVVHPKILNQLEVVNQLETGSVDVIEADLFNYQTEKKYDLVVSNGLIEHFLDTKEIIQKHIEQLSPQGTLLITLPNFKSLNGWFQEVFDKENYDKHNISCMDLKLLKNICQDLSLKNIEVRYDGRFMLWFENKNQRPIVGRILKKILWLPFKVFFKIIPIETKAFSPYIVLAAQK